MATAPFAAQTVEHSGGEPHVGVGTDRRDQAQARSSERLSVLPSGSSSASSARASGPGSHGHLEQAKPPREYRRATLWAVLIFGVVALAWMAWQLSRQLNASSTSLKSEADPNDRPA